jgi:Transglycosylase-like domain
LRVLSGRLKAVVVATLATIVLVGVIGPSTTLASDPPGLFRFMYAMGQVESGGNYYARNASSGAYGKYQIMPSNWPSWAGRYLGDSSARQTPANQEIVAAGKFRSLYRGLDSWRRVAYWWLTGSSQTTGWSEYATRYVAKVMTIYRGEAAEKAAAAKAAAPARPVAAPARPVAGASTAIYRYSETSSKITYTGSWRSAGHRGYAGDAAAYATKAGATASFAFRGSKVTWYGPVGPTRGQARVLVDGTYVKTVNLHARSFTARVALFSRSWSSAGAHTLVIQVVGTAGHPYVAIDGFTVVD